jgi:hypothetical protein
MSITSLPIDEEGWSSIMDGLGGFLNKVGDFVRDTLSSRGPYWGGVLFRLLCFALPTLDGEPPHAIRPR